MTAAIIALATVTFIAGFAFGYYIGVTPEHDHDHE
jgi:hypothetical protein